MKRVFSALGLIAIFLLGSSLDQSEHLDADNGIQIIVNPDQSYQSIEGWGSSLCWWAGQVGKWEEEKVDSIIDLITSPDKLNMNIFRYNIGGGDDPSHIGGHMVKGKGKRAEMEGFKSSPEAPYDWNADEGQRTIMLKIKERRPDAIFEAFSNSPPFWMTFSGCSAGNVDPMDDNLKPEYHEAFCDYLIDVCLHYKEHYGIEFKTLEPFNESTSGYWGYLGSQEGCHFEPETQMKIIRLLYPKLRSSGLNTVISASDETNIASFIDVLKTYQDAGDILDKVDQLNTHTYSGTNPERMEAYELVKTTGKEFWQSETGPGGGNQPRRARGLENNLYLAQKMIDDIRLMKPQAWLDWQLMEENNNTWCQMTCNFETQEYNTNKNFFVRQQVSRFFQKGYTFIETGYDASIAAMNPDNNELVISIVNTSDSIQFCSLDLHAIRQTANTAWVYRTSATEDCEKLTSIAVNRKEIFYEAPGKTITTFVLHIGKP